MIADLLLKQQLHQIESKVLVVVAVIISPKNVYVTKAEAADKSINGFNVIKSSE